MNPFLLVLKEILRNKLVLLVIGAATGASTTQSLPFLAKVIHPNRVSEGRAIINSARKDRVVLEVTKDSISKINTAYDKTQIIKEPKNEEVSRSINTNTDIQLDSLLTNYRYIPFTKE